MSDKKDYSRFYMDEDEVEIVGTSSETETVEADDQPELPEETKE